MNVSGKFLRANGIEASYICWRVETLFALKMSVLCYFSWKFMLFQLETETYHHFSAEKFEKWNYFERERERSLKRQGSLVAKLEI